jgi:hypothetical protein
MSRFLLSLVGAALLVATWTACKQGLNDRCQLDSDCEDGLTCNLDFSDDTLSADGVCVPIDTVPDAGPDEGGEDRRPTEDTAEDAADAADGADGPDAAKDGGPDGDMPADTADAVDMTGDAPADAKGDVTDAPMDAPGDMTATDAAGDAAGG